MGQDPPRRSLQHGFHNTFGQGRSIKRDSIQGEGQRSSGDTAPNPKRIRTVDRPDERSAVDQRDHVEGSSPTTLASHRQRHPDNLKQHPSSQLSKAPTSHVSGIPYKPLLDFLCDRNVWYRLKMEAYKTHKRVIESQEQHHYRPSDYISSSELLDTQQRNALEDIRKAEKNMVEIDVKIASAMQPLLRHISEALGKSSDGSNASEERVASETKINAIQTTMKKEMEESLKKEVAESQKLVKELIGSQMIKAKEALAQENEQKLHSLQKTLAQEGEDRATSLRKILLQEHEKRVAEMKESINREHRAKITALENALADEAKNKDRIAALEKSLSNEAKNKDRIAALEKSLSNEAKNRDRIAALEKSLSDEVRNKDRIAQLEKSLSEQVRNKDRIAQLEKSLSEQVRNKDRIAELEESWSEQENYQKRTAELENTFSEHREKNSGLQKRVAIAEARLDRAEADQKLLVKSLVDPKQLTTVSDRVLRLEENLEEALSEQRLLSETSIKKAQLAEQLQQLSLSQDDKLSKQEARVNDHSTTIKRLEGQLCDHSKLITENKQHKEAATARLDSLESTISNFSAEWQEMKKRVEKLSSIRSASVSDNKILEVVKPEVEKLEKNIRESIAQIKSNLQPFIVQERYRRETLEEQFGNVTRQISEIEKEHAMIKADYYGLVEAVNDQKRLNILEGSRLEEKFNSRLNLFLDKFKSQMEALYIQVQSLNAWQTNFNTAGLYKDIISHINKTIPEGPGTAPHITGLKQQLNNIETRLSTWENTSNKRRKLPGGNIRVVNGRRIDAQ
ncbi:hypothetical protein J3F84DRAFT_364370 [Trichoderma pleuroticola]